MVAKQAAKPMVNSLVSENTHAHDSARLPLVIMSRVINTPPSANRPTPPWLRNAQTTQSTIHGAVLTHQTSEAPEWGQLRSAASGNHAADAVLVLQGLTENRHRLGAMNEGAAGALLSALQASSSWHPEAAAQVMRLALPLLARYALTAGRMSTAPGQLAAPTTSGAASKAAANTLAAVLSQAITWVVSRLRSSAVPLEPGACAAAVLFLGTGFKACPADLRHEVWAVLCDLMHLPATTASTAAGASTGKLPHLPPPPALFEGVAQAEDVATGVRLVVGELLQEDPGRAHWLVSCWLSAVTHIAVIATCASTCSPADGSPACGPMQQAPCSPPGLPAELHELRALVSVQHALRAAAQMGAALRQLGMGVVQQLVGLVAAPASPPATACAAESIVEGLMRVVGMIQDGCVPLVGANADASSSHSTVSHHRHHSHPHPHSLTPEEESLSTTCLLAGAGLLEGVDAGVRQLAAAAQPRVVGLLGRAVAGLVAGVQAGLSLACLVDAGAGEPGQQGLGAGQQLQLPMTASSQVPSMTAPGVSTGGMMLRWGAGLAYGRLRGSVVGASLCTQLQPPGPAAAVHLLGLVAGALCSVCAGSPVTGLAARALISSTPPAVARAWLADEVGGSPLYADAPVVAKALVEELRALFTQVPKDWQPASTPLGPAHHSNQPPGGWAHEQAFDDVFGQAASGPAAPQGPPPAVLRAEAVGAGVLREVRAGAARAAHAWSSLTLYTPPGWIELLVMQPPPLSAPGAGGGLPLPSSSGSGAAPSSGQQLREVLDRLWVLTLTPLSVALQLWPRAPQGASLTTNHLAPAVHAAVPMPAMAAAGLLGRPAVGLAALLAAADLQFCAVQLPITVELVKAAVGEVAGSPDACGAMLDALPCYEVLTQPVPSAGQLQPPHGTTAAVPVYAVQGTQRTAQPVVNARWAADAVVGAKVAFLLPIAAVCATRTRDTGAAAHQLLPLLFLLMQHPQAPLVTASHTAFTTLISHLSGDQVKPGQTSTPQSVLLVEQVLPYYIQRNLLLPLLLPCLDGLEKGLPIVLRAVPAGSPTAMYCLRQLTDTAVGWLKAHPNEPLDFSPLYVAPGAQGLNAHEPLPVAPQVKLVSLACSTVLLCDWQLLPQMAEAVADVVAAAATTGSPSFPSSWADDPTQASDADAAVTRAMGTCTARRAAVLQHLHDLLLRSDDYSRKPQLFDWLQQLAMGSAACGGARVLHQGSTQRGRAEPMAVVFS